MFAKLVSSGISKSDIASPLGGDCEGGNFPIRGNCVGDGDLPRWDKAECIEWGNTPQ